MADKKTTQVEVLEPTGSEFKEYCKRNHVKIYAGATIALQEYLMKQREGSQDDKRNKAN